MISSNIGISVVMYSKAEATLEDHESSVRQVAADQQQKKKRQSFEGTKDDF